MWSATSTFKVWLSLDDSNDLVRERLWIVTKKPALDVGRFLVYWNISGILMNEALSNLLFTSPPLPPPLVRIIPSISISPLLHLISHFHTSKSLFSSSCFPPSCSLFLFVRFAYFSLFPPSPTFLPSLTPSLLQLLSVCLPREWDE